jgi:arabinogalactan endo-1,4-beta-galactosidase
MPNILLNGGDITELNYVEDKGGIFYDFNGNRRDALEILAENGWNIARIRVYNNPGKGRGNGTYYLPEGYQDINDALKLAKRAKNAGMQIQFTLHFSDYWTNPETQIIPHDWQALINGKPEADAVQILNEKIYKFTKDALMRMKSQGTTPEFVSLGNETRTGILFPYGTTDKWDVLAGFYNSGARAVREIAPDPKVIIHLDDGGNPDTYLTYFQNARQRNVDYDIIGASYYPFWTKKTAAQFASFANSVAEEFNKPIMCMETGFNWTARTGAGNIGQLGDNGPYGPIDASTQELQKDFLIELFNEMRSIKNGMCIGSLYWDPVMIYAGGKTGWAYYESNDMNTANVVDNTTLFDFDGRALPALSAYKNNIR